MTEAHEEGITGVARSAVEGLKTNPSCLAAIVLAGLFAVLTFYAMQRDADRRSRTVDVLMERCYGTTKPGAKQ